MKRVCICLMTIGWVLSSHPLGVHAQKDASIVTSTTSSSAPQFYGREDVPTLEINLAKTTKEFDKAHELWNATDGSTATKVAKNASDALRSAEQNLEAIKAELAKARTAPTRELVAKRYYYDLEVSRLTSIHQRLSKRGQYYQSLISAQQEVLNRQELRKDVEATIQQTSQILDKLTAPEKLEEQIRASEDKLAAIRRQNDHLEGLLFNKYIDIESLIIEAIAAYQKLQKLWPPISRSIRAINYNGGTLSPEQIRRDLITQTGSEFDTIGQLWKEITQGFRNIYSSNTQPIKSESSRNLSVFQYHNQLRDFQREIAELSLLISKQKEDEERLRASEAEKSRGAREPEIEPIVTPNATNEYVRIGTQIANYNSRLEILLLEKERLKSDLEEVQDELSERQGEEKSAQLRLKKRREHLEQLRTESPILLISQSGRHIEKRPRILRNFVASERISAASEAVRALERKVRLVEIRRDVLQRKISVNEEEYSEIQDHRLPDLRRDYYLSVGQTFGIRGLRVFIVLFFAYTLHRMIRRGSGPFIERMVERTLRRQGAEAIREQRARTLMSVFLGTGRFFISILAILFVIGQLDIDYGPLLVAAGGLSLAVGFGAQSLVKDFFAGFFILLEGQYSIGDVVMINDKSGIVEDLNLRTTIIRSIDGEVHTIPNGEISITTNKTKSWSRAVVDVSVAYEENIDEIINVLKHIADDFSNHEHWEDKVRAIEVLGVEALGDSAVIIRVLIETAPGKQWAVSREFKRRIKIEFTNLGIEIPWPQRVVTNKPSTGGITSTSVKQQKIRRYLGASADTSHEAPAISIEERDRADAIANKEAALREDIEPEDDESTDSDNPPTLMDLKIPPTRSSSMARARAESQASALESTKDESKDH